jgi:GTA TIM-barrel-like domain/Putative phage tail protein
LPTADCRLPTANCPTPRTPPIATLALAAVGAAAGSALLPAGFSVLGVALTGAAIGSQIGALAGSYIDQALFGPSAQSRAVQGPRLSDLHVTASTEGAAIPRVYGAARVGGQVIWSTDIEEVATTTQAGGGGKGGGGGTATTTSTAFSYFANFAVALAEGEISALGRVWANGQEIDLSNITHRVYTGAPDQPADTLIAAREGAASTPAFRGTAYVVFERLPLAPYGNRIPQLSFEVFRSIEPFAEAIRGVVVIPGSGEFVYQPTPVTLTTGYRTSTSENVHSRQGGTDWTVSMDQLGATLPNATSVSLIVSWFGTDLRAGQCQLYPGVERRDKETSPDIWSVAGLTRANAYAVSQRDGRPAYGGTPCDASVVAAIRDLKTRGKRVTLTPFILMDVPSGNTLDNPYGGASQPAYPWRGRITASPAAGQQGSPDKTAAAATQIATFVGSASPSHFTLSGDTVVYTGPAEWSFRRMVLHQAMLAKAAGGIDAFVIGTELRGLSTVRSGPATYPFVTALVSLAADVKSILGAATKVTYAADWSEYFGHQPPDSSGDVNFHLDPLWASPDIDAIGMDVYWPLADWRDGRAHADFVAGTSEIYDLTYLKRNVTGGEGYDWYYRSQADRNAQVRTPITDSLGKPWTFRYKDIRSWWLNPHYNRAGGVESTTPTPWVPQSKPFWFMEVGCGAVDKAANEPNVFVDPKSSENALPQYSRGQRDDLMQRRYLRALIEAFDPRAQGYVPGTNPVSTLTGAPMVALDRIHVYAWDARPYPAFPANTELWGDGGNWRLGHWLNGRFAGAPLSETVAAILEDYGFTRHDTQFLTGSVTGYVIDRVMSARDALHPIELAYFVDTVESGGLIRFLPRGTRAPVLTLAQSDLVETKPDQALLGLTRGQETELPTAAKIRYLAAGNDYRQAVAESRRLSGASGRLSQADIAIVMDADQAQATAESWLFETWASRERASFKLPPSALALEPGDAVALDIAGEPRLFRLTGVGEHGVRDIEALSLDPEVYGRTNTADRPASSSTPVVAGQPAVLFLDLPLLRGDEAPHSGYAAALMLPWPGGVAIYASPETSGFRLKALAVQPATIGTLTAALAAGPRGRLDHANTLTVTLGSGALTSASPIQVFAGANAAAIQTASGDWEVIQFTRAELVAAKTYALTGLIRGQAGTDATLGPAIPKDSPFVLLDGAVTEIALTAAETRLPLNWRYGPSNRDIGDQTYAGAAHTFQALALRPLSPVHVRGTRSANGDLTVTFIRRTRAGGDSWDATEPPLSEDAERYEADIVSGVTVKRTIAVASPTFLYTAAQQTADFGVPQSALAVRIAQVSSTFGRGAAATATV